MNQRERMDRGQLYLPGDPQIMKQQAATRDLLWEFNQLKPSQTNEMKKLMKQMFAEIGPDCYLERPVRANWGCRHVHLGRGVYFNFNATFVDDCDIYVGDHTMCGPNITIVTAAHPVWPSLRLREYQYNLPVFIGKNCWLGAGVTILPGVHIGDNSVIGAESLVTHDIPAGVVAYGSPCRVQRQINQHDREYYHKQLKIDWDNITDVNL